MASVGAAGRRPGGRGQTSCKTPSAPGCLTDNEPVRPVNVCTLGHTAKTRRGSYDSGSNMISRTSCAHRQPLAMRAAQTKASSRVGTSIIEKPPTTAFVSGTGPSEAVPSGATIVACWRRTPPPKIQTPAALASRTTACEASPTSGQSPSGMWLIEPSSNEIRYRGISVPPILWLPLLVKPMGPHLSRFSAWSPAKSTRTSTGPFTPPAASPAARHG